MHVCDSARSSHAESHGGVLSYARPGTPNTTLNHHCVHDLFTVKWGGGVILIAGYILYLHCDTSYR